MDAYTDGRLSSLFTLCFLAIASKVADIQTRLPHVTAQKERLWACTMRVENLAQQFCENVSEDCSQILWGISLAE
ncbi:hypothetical protein DFH09DRAFT_1241575 [Mycena vulgaris]|nr:hypothetical protein DFH09DRAFT_1241575 [Mycena vulgaris]